MTLKLAVLTAGFSCALAAGASAIPMNEVPTQNATAIPVRMVCNEYGRCWDRADNPGEAIARGVIRGVEGRSVDRDYDRDRGYRRGWDRDREYRRRGRDWDDD